MSARFEAYKEGHKKAAARRNAEVVNGCVFYRTKVELGEAISEAMTARRFRIIPCSQTTGHGPEPCPNCHIELWDEDGDLITHPGNDDDELPDGVGYTKPTERQVEKNLRQIRSLTREESS